MNDSDLKSLSNEKLIDHYVTCRIALGIKIEEPLQERQEKYLAARHELDRRLNRTPYESFIAMLEESGLQYHDDIVNEGSHYHQAMKAVYTVIVDTDNTLALLGDPEGTSDWFFDASGKLVGHGAAGAADDDDE